MLQSGDGCDELTLVIGKGLQEARTNAISTAPRAHNWFRISFPKVAYGVSCGPPIQS